jgi:dTDP-4-amino-4,6-dideoxygalactose transaminase
MNFIDFNRPAIVGKEIAYIQDAILNQKALCGNGYYTRKCTTLLEQRFKIKKALLTTSCTTALEMAAILLDLKPDDEVIVPSYTFVSTANAFILRGAKPVFIDIRPDTLNLDESQLESLITPKTRAIFVVHYAGVGAEMNTILEIARQYNLFVVEDAAQGIGATYHNNYLGTLGHLGTYSFHETKNVICGEGGALLINDEQFIDRAEILLEKGTNRKQFCEGMVDKYTWVDIGSSYVLSELNAAYLYGQLENENLIFKKRLSLFETYYEALLPLQQRRQVRLPIVPAHCEQNGHMFYLICRSNEERNTLIHFLQNKNIQAVFHYIPLHQSPMGQKWGKDSSLPITEYIAARLVRLPMFYALTEEEQTFIIKTIFSFFESRG